MSFPDRLRALHLVPLLLLAALAFPAGAGAQTRDGEVRVEGNQRIETETVRQYMGLGPARAPTDEDLDKALKGLFDSGLFADVAIRRDGPDVVVTVVENPIINRIAFEGNKRIDDEILAAEVELRPRVVFTRARVQRDVQRLLDIYRRSGRFTVRVDPKVVELPQNRLDLIFEIREGELTEVRSIAFAGNRVFDDGDLRGVIQTKEAAWYRFFAAGASTYDADRLTVDRDLLRKHYLSEGYADFRVITAVGELTPEKDAFLVTFALSEGSRYKFGEIAFDSALEDLDVGLLEPHVTFRSGDWYDADEIETSIGNLTDALGDLGYAHIEVETRTMRDGENLVVNIEFVIAESPRVTVERIEISGNVRTEDRVIRREMLLAEGDVFNSSRLRRSRQRLLNLGFFATVDVTPEPGSAPDRTVIAVAVSERATGELSIGVGYSTEGGLLSDLGVRERNLLGRGQDLELNLRVGTEQNEAVVRFTEPYFLERELSAGFDVYRSNEDLQDESSYDSRRTGVALRARYRFNEPLTQRWIYTFERSEVRDVGANASAAVREQQGSTTTSSVGQTLAYDKRDVRIDPKDGYLLSWTSSLAGLAGDRRHFRNEVGAEYYYPVAEDWIVSAEVGSAYIYDFGKDTRLSERYFLGGSTLRGFESRGVGPRFATGNNDALGGDLFYRGSLRLTFPVGLPTELGVRGSVFTDAGWLGWVAPRPDVLQDHSLRASIGLGMAWRTPLGPLTLSWAWPVAQEDYDKTERFRLGVGARF